MTIVIGSTAPNSTWDIAWNGGQQAGGTFDLYSDCLDVGKTAVLILGKMDC